MRAAVVDRMSESTGRGGMPALARVGLAAAVGLVAAGLQAAYGPLDLAPLVGWDVLALALLGLPGGPSGR